MQDAIRRTLSSIPGMAPAVFLCAGILLSLAACEAEAPGQSRSNGQQSGEVVFPVTNRPDVRGVTGAVSAGHPLAAAAGYDVLRRGGNAMDAAIAMAGVLAVVRPHMNGVGGDAFALYYEAESGRVHAMNGSGRAGALATPALFVERGLDAVPGNGPLSVSVPGAVAGWVDALERFGTLPHEELLTAAIGYARNGFPVSTRLASDIRAQSGALNDHAQALFLPGGEPPPVGSLLRNPGLAATLERIARDGKEGFYHGFVADHLAAFIEAEGGYVRAPDLAAHTTTWVEPLSGEYKDYTMLVLPPNTQGIAQLQLFEMSKAFDVAGMGHNSAAYLHTLIEMKKLAFADRDQWAADPDFTDIPLENLLDPAYLAGRAGMVDPNEAAEGREPGVAPTAMAARAEGIGSAPRARSASIARSDASRATRADPSAADDSGDTVYLTAVDQWGNAVSWIQSLFAGFGSGLLEPETGIVLHNRGALFNLEAGHPNIIAPGKRPYHTLTPMMALHGDGSFAFTLGTPGGDSQPQSLLQIVNNMAHFGMTPQAAIEAPRFRSYGGLGVAFEDRVDASVLGQLEALGHEVEIVHGWTSTFGGAHMILRDPAGTLTAASDPRREAYAIAY